ncbi:SRPBCC family protein [Actinoplanes sp. DH11]|uniref:SRPBCC family protein n=1 Tax=Actinoplanes sp. DH11 TaxID=2857011 RepID=UPI001E60641E|nr:SRPBCC family protein [Actinoplanes sp. DH11]
MARFTVTQDVRAPASVAWAVLVDWPRHGDWVPLTTVRTLSPRPDGVGARFVARTGAGPLGFDDPMTVVGWEVPEGDEPGARPGRCEVVKSGRVVHGRALFTVAPLAGGGARVTWHEDVTLSPRRITRHAEPVVAAAGRLAFAATMRAFARDAERAATIR